MEITPRDGFSSLCKHHRIIRGTVDFCVNDVLHKVDGVICNTMNLRTAAHGIGILDAVTETVALGYLRGMVVRVQQGAETGGHLNLAWVWPQGMDVAVEGLGGPLEHLQGEGGDDVRLSGDRVGSLHRLSPQGGNHLGPIDQSQALFRPEYYGFKSMGL